MFSVMRFLAALLTAALALGASPTAQAQNFFEQLFGAFNSQPQRSVDYYGNPPGRQRGPAAPSSQERRAARSGGGEAQSGHGEGYCVRLCDGYYFPLVRTGGETKQQACDYGCPGTTMAVYEGSAIETARAGGERYASLPAAFSFRDKTTKNCSCNFLQSAAFSTSALGKDPTLRSGDIVFANSGAFVYQGSKLAPVRVANLSRGVRDHVRALLVAGKKARDGGGEAASAAAAPPLEAALSFSSDLPPVPEPAAAQQESRQDSRDDPAKASPSSPVESEPLAKEQQPQAHPFSPGPLLFLFAGAVVVVAARRRHGPAATAVATVKNLLARAWRACSSSGFPRLR
jgi:hypothetical protein